MFGRRKRPGISRKSFTAVDEGNSAAPSGLTERPTKSLRAARPGTDLRTAKAWPPVPVRPAGSGMRSLVVGREIRLNAEVASCEILRVEGRLEAELTDTQSLEIAETGFFKGSAAVAECRVRGEFEGNLTVQGCLLIGRGGRVRGDIRYGEIEIQNGGQISGKVQLLNPRPQAPVAASGARTDASRSTLPAVAPAGAPKRRGAKTGPGSGARADRGRNS